MVSNKNTSDKIWELLLETDIGCRYHSSRSSFLSILDKIIVSIIFLTSLLALSGIELKLSSFIAMMLSIILLIYKPLEKSAYNHQLRLRYHELLIKVEFTDSKKNFTDNKYHILKQEYDSITKDEEERFVIVDAVCANNVFTARNCDKAYLIIIPRFKRYLMHLWPFYSFNPKTYQ